jgi:hypothetical protein
LRKDSSNGEEDANKEKEIKKKLIVKPMNNMNYCKKKNFFRKLRNFL